MIRWLVDNVLQAPAGLVKGVIVALGFALPFWLLLWVAWLVWRDWRACA